jgi:hypothetical protein
MTRVYGGEPVQWTFDGRDVSDPVSGLDDVRGYLLACSWCGTLRAHNRAFCCEFAADTPRLAAPCPPGPPAHRGQRNGHAAPAGTLTLERVVSADDAC